MHDFVETQRMRRDRHELGRGCRIAAGKEGDVMPLADQLLGEKRNDRFRSRRKASAEHSRIAEQLGRFS